MIYLIALMVFVIMVCAVITAWTIYGMSLDIAVMRLIRK